jgi:hypothetical protein
VTGIVVVVVTGVVGVTVGVTEPLVIDGRGGQSNEPMAVVVESIVPEVTYYTPVAVDTVVGVVVVAVIEGVADVVVGVGDETHPASV